MIFGIGGISLDAWRAFNDRRELSAIADGAAVAGASEIDLEQFKRGGTPPVIVLDGAKAKSRASDYIDFAAGQSGVKITSREVQVTDNAVIVTLHSDLELTLAALLVPNESIDVAVRGVADPRPG